MMTRSLGIIAVVLLLSAGCGVNSTGLDNPPDTRASTGGALGPSPCPANIVDKADWPGGSPPADCLKPCGPDDIGTRTCTTTDVSTCKASVGCVCQQGPCVTCNDCVFTNLPRCYVPNPSPTRLNCAASAEKGGTCTPACNKELCMRADGKTGCVCNEQGKYACAIWGGSTWK